jgi:hypothetical protein
MGEKKYLVNISLETNKEQFGKYTNKLKFISFSDYNKWNSKAAKDYYVFGTPTLFLLDSNNQIILRPNSIKQLESWIDMYFTSK